MNLPSGGNLIQAARVPGAVIVLSRGGTYTGVVSPANGVTVAAEKPADANDKRPAPVLIGQILANESHDVTLDGFKVQPKGKGSVKGVDLFHVQRLKLLNLDVCGFGWMGITVQGLAGKRCTDVVLRGCNVSDNYPLDPSKHSAGAYFQFVDGLTLDLNVFSHNGGAPGTETKFNHNVYVHGSNGPAVVTGNVFHDASSHGLQQRSGGVCTGNTFLDNPIQHSYGLVNGEMCYPGGVSGTITNNLYIGSGAIAGQQMGWGIELANLKDVALSRCLFAHDQAATEAAVAVKMPSNLTNPGSMLPASHWKLALQSFYVWDRKGGALSVEPGIAKPIMGANAGALPPKQADLRAVLGVGFMPWARLNPTQASPAAVSKCFAAAGVN